MYSSTMWARKSIPNPSHWIRLSSSWSRCGGSLTTTLRDYSNAIFTSSNSHRDNNTAAYPHGMLGFHKTKGNTQQFKISSKLSPPLTFPQRWSSSTATTTDTNLYTVAKICYTNATVEIQDLTVSEILQRASSSKSKSSNKSVHVRDLFSLALTSKREHEMAMLDGRRSKHKKKRPPTAILPRHDDIIVSFGNTRALIGKEYGMLFDAHKSSVQSSANTLAKTFAQKRSSSTPSSSNNNNNTSPEDPPELIFLEGILLDVCDTYNQRIKLYEPIVDTTISRVTQDFLSDSGMHRLLPIKSSLQKFEMKLQSALTCLTHLLENEEDMLQLLLTEKSEAEEKGEVLDPNRHESVELLVEEYARQLENLMHETNYLLKKVQSKQELVAISLDTYRNRIIRMSLYISIASLGFAISTTVAGFFGMNVLHGYEESPTAFADIVAGTSFAGVAFMVGCIAYARGPIMKRMARQGWDELSHMHGALNNMNALDNAMKVIAYEDKAFSKAEFREILMENEHCTTRFKEAEVDLLFEMLDTTKDGYIYSDDFLSLTNEGTMKQIPSLGQAKKQDMPSSLDEKKEQETFSK